MVHPPCSLGNKGSRKSQVPRIDYEAGARNGEGGRLEGEYLLQAAVP